MIEVFAKKDNFINYDGRKLFSNKLAIPDLLPYLYSNKRQKIVESLKNLTDEELVALLIQGSEAAFTMIYKRYWTVLYGQAVRMLKDEDDAQDAVQDVFAALYGRRGSLKADTRIATYLYVALRNRIVNLIQQRKVRVDYVAALMGYPEPSADTVSSAVTEREIQRAMDEEIGRMPAKMRHAFVLSRQEDLTNKEIAKLLAVRESTVKTHINNALKIIRVRLKGFTGLFF